MVTEALRLLGLGVGASPAQIRRAFRARAFAVHPDRNPGDPAAAARFRALVAARRTLLGARGAARRPVPPPPMRERFVCVTCDDTFPYSAPCPRCDAVPHDSRSGPTPAAPHDPRVTAFVAMLEEARPPGEPLFVPGADFAYAVALFFLLFGMSVMDMGIPVVGQMLAVFGAAVALRERFVRLGRARVAPREPAPG